MTASKKHPEGVYSRAVIRDGRRVQVWDATVEAPRGADGRRRKLWKRGFANQRAAVRWRRDHLARADRGEWVEPSRITLAEYLEEWLPGIRGSIRPSTWTSYASHVRVHLVPHLGSARLQTITVEDVNKLYSELLESGLAPATVVRVHSTFRRALRDARRSGRLQRNVAEDANRPRVEQRAIRAWTPGQTRAFLRFAQERAEGLYPLFALTFSTGMRRGEVLGLRWTDTDLENGVIRVQQTLLASGKHLSIGQPKTRRGRRSIALDAQTGQHLRMHRANQLERRLALGEAWQETGLVFDRGDGAPLHPDAVSKSFRRCAAAAGLPAIRFHDARHTAATLMLTAGINPKVVSERLGHATIAITLDTYSHVLPNLQEEAADRTAALVYG